MAELQSKRRVHLLADQMPAIVRRRRASPMILGALLLWGLAIGASAIVTTPPARRAEWWNWGTGRYQAWSRRWSRFSFVSNGGARGTRDEPSGPAFGVAGQGAQPSPTATPPRAHGDEQRSSRPPYPGGDAGTLVAAPSSSVDVGARGSLPTCEAALHAHRERAMDGADAGLAVTAGEYHSVLAQGSYLADCAGAYEADVSLCVAVREGRVVGVSARTEPPQPEIADCLRRVVASLTLEPNVGIDVTEVSFAGR